MSTLERAIAIAAGVHAGQREGEDYESFVLRAAADPIGRRVKLEDLRDNADLSRIASPTARDLEHAERYRRAIALIE